MRVLRPLAAGGAALALLLLVAPANPAQAQTAAPVTGGFADARGIVVDLTVLTAVPVPGPLGGTPIDPNTFATSSQSCPANDAEPATDALVNVNAAPAASADTINTIAGADCTAPVAVASAQTEGAKALFNAGVPLITADVIRAQANSDCSTAPNAQGSLFANLVVNGTPVPLGPLGVPAPNTTITIPGVATVIVNEQRPAAGGRGIVVNGVHVIGASPLLRGDLIISHASSGVVCPNGKGSEVGEGLMTPDITFTKSASPSTAKPGGTVTYTATLTNRSATPCSVITVVDHLNPVVELVSTAGGFGSESDMPVPLRSDGGQDVVLRPTGVTIAPGASVVQTVVVTMRAATVPGTYFNDLEVFCAVNGNFVSGPLAPVRVPAVVAPPTPPLEVAPVQLPRTGGSATLALGAVALLGAAAGFGRRARTLA